MVIELVIEGSPEEITDLTITFGRSDYSLDAGEPRVIGFQSDTEDSDV